MQDDDMLTSFRVHGAKLLLDNECKLVMNGLARISIGMKVTVIYY